MPTDTVPALTFVAPLYVLDELVSFSSDVPILVIDPLPLICPVKERSNAEPSTVPVPVSAMLLLIDRAAPDGESVPPAKVMAAVPSGVPPALISTVPALIVSPPAKLLLKPKLRLPEPVLLIPPIETLSFRSNSAPEATSTVRVTPPRASGLLIIAAAPLPAVTDTFPPSVNTPVSRSISPPPSIVSDAMVSDEAGNANQYPSRLTVTAEVFLIWLLAACQTLAVRAAPLPSPTTSGPAMASTVASLFSLSTPWFTVTVPLNELKDPPVSARTVAVSSGESIVRLPVPVSPAASGIRRNGSPPAI